MTITVYSKPNCVQCDATYRTLDKKGIEYAVVDISKEPSAVDVFKELGFMSAPVVQITREDGSTHAWSGFRVDEINTLASELATA